MSLLFSKALLDKLLTSNGNGWLINLFVDNNKLNDESIICALCNNVCKSAVEFVCMLENGEDAHKESELKSYCECCVKQALKANGNKCLISGHPSPKYGSLRGYRRMILKLQVFCPNSVQYHKKQMQMESKKADDGTEEGLMVESTEFDDGCSFSGSLGELIEDHIQGCIQQRMKSEKNEKYNNSNRNRIQSLMIAELQQKMEEMAEELKSLKTEIVSQNENTKKSIIQFLENMKTELKLEMNILRITQVINHHLKLISIIFYKNENNISGISVEWKSANTNSTEIVYNLEVKKPDIILNENQEQKMMEEENNNNMNVGQWQIFSKLNINQRVNEIIDGEGILIANEQYFFRISACTTNDMQLYSNIIKKKCLPLFLSSLLTTNDENYSLYQMIPNVDKYTFLLLFRASRDGFTAKAFHSKCDGKSPTITIVHSEFDHVFGSYTPCEWHSNAEYVSDPSLNTFLFLLRTQRENDRKGIPFKFQINSKEYGIYCSSSYGPTFGNGFHFNLCNNCNSSNSSYSELGNGKFNAPKDNNMLAGAKKFKVSDYEVWQLLSLQ